VIFSAEAGQNQNERPSYSHGEIVGIGGCSLGAGAIPALSSNRDTPPFCPCCLSCLGSTGRVCGVPSATVCVGQSFGRTEAPTPKTGCESLALPCSRSTAESDRRAWARYSDLWRRISRLEVESLYSAEPVELIRLRAEQTALITQVDRHLENCRGPYALG